MQLVCHSIQYHIKPGTLDTIFSISKLLYSNTTIVSCQFRYHNALNPTTLKFNIIQCIKPSLACHSILGYYLLDLFNLESVL